MSRMFLLLSALLLSGSQSFAASKSNQLVQYVGSITINACQQDAKILAKWYSRFGFETQEFGGVYFAQIDTAAGPFIFGIHPKLAHTSKNCSGNISVTYRVENFKTSLLLLREKGINPESTEITDFGQFAYFHDPDGNEVKIWGE